METCIFCQIVTKKVPASIVYEDNFVIAFLDKYPQTRGHIQLVPKKHYRWIYEIPEIGTFFESAQKIIHGIIPVLGADHVTLATFGYQIEHAHLWIVPQYKKKVLVSESGRSQGKGFTEVAELLKKTLFTNFQAPNSK